MRRFLTRSRIRAINTALIVIVVICIGSYGIDRALLSRTYARYVPDQPNLLCTYDDISADYPRTDESFEMNGQVLRGHVYGPDNDSRGLVVFRHGIFSQHQDYLALIRALVDKGWKVFAYDAIGCGESDGDSTIGMPQSALDVRAALDYVQQSGMAADLPVVLFGHSWGGYGVAAALDSDTPVKAVVTMSGFYSPMAILTESAQGLMGMFGYIQQPFITLINSMDFGDDANRSAIDAINSCDVPVLVIHGDADETVSYGRSSIISRMDRVTNPNARDMTMSEEGRNGHNDYFYSPQSQAYLNAKTEELDALVESSGGELSDEEFSAFRAQVDIEAANTADPGLMDTIDSFFASAIQ